MQGVPCTEGEAAPRKWPQAAQRNNTRWSPGFNRAACRPLERSSTTHLGAVSAATKTAANLQTNNDVRVCRRCQRTQRHTCNCHAEACRIMALELSSFLAQGNFHWEESEKHRLLVTFPIRCKPMIRVMADLIVWGNLIRLLYTCTASSGDFTVGASRLAISAETSIRGRLGPQSDRTTGMKISP